MQAKKEKTIKKPPTNKPKPVSFDSILHLPTRKKRQIDGEKVIKTTKKKSIYHTIGRKRLLEWMESHNLTLNDLVVLMKAYYQNVWGWTKGIRRPDLESAVLLQRLTEGFVTCDSWLESLPANPSESKNNAKK